MAWSISMSTSESYNPGANQSTVYATLYLNWSSWDSYANYDVEGYLNIGGNVAGAAAPRAVNYPNGSQSGSVGILSHSVTFNHDANGYRGAVGTSGSFDGDGGYSPGDLSVGGTTYGAVDYDRKPGACSSVSASRSGTSYTVYAGSASSPAGTPTYYVQYSENGGSYGNQRTMSGQAYTYTGLTNGVTYRFRVWAANSDGTGPAIDSGPYTMPTVPLAPASITVGAPVGRSVTVTAGTAPNGGSTVTGYAVQYSTNAGSSWSSPQTMTAQSYTYPYLDGGLTYLFRVYAVNEMGNGATTVSTGTFVPSGGKRWNGTEFVPVTIAKRWNGSQWVNITVAKRWNGTDWVDLS